MMKQRLKDAWRQLYELMGRYTREWKVRPDIEVMAWGTDRNVELRIGELRENYTGPLDIRGKYSWRSTGQRNVGTMRELANVLNAACDFVEASNPEWAEHASQVRLTPVDEMVVADD